VPLKQVDLTADLVPLEWFLPGLLLRGYLNFLASLPGQGKTTLLTALAWQASRPSGGEFLGGPVSPAQPSMWTSTPPVMAAAYASGLPNIRPRTRTAT
jgi:hypothetical protein